MARTIAMPRPLCFAKWDRYFYFSGQQWLGVHSPRAMLSIALSRPARATYRATCAGLGKPARHHGQGDARTAASGFLLRLGFCELALAAESLAGLTVQALGVGLLRAAQRNRPLVSTCRRGIRGIAPLGPGSLPIDPDARARRNLVGRLSESRAAGQQGQDSSDRKDSTDFHCDV